MAVTVPSTPARVLTSQTGTQARIKADTWEDAAETQHYAFAYSGARIPGRYYDSPATTTSTSLTQANSSGEGLETWFPVSRLIRKAVDSSTDSLILEVQIFGAQVEARVTVTQIDTATTLGTVDVTQSSSTFGWASDTLAISYSSGDEDIELAYKIEYKATSGTASLVTWALHEMHLTASNLP